MGPYAFKSYFIALLISARDKINKSKEEKLEIKFSISFLLLGMSEVFLIESRVKLRENKVWVCDANSSLCKFSIQSRLSSG